MKMKTNSGLLIALATSLFFTACVEDNDYTVPQNLGVEENSKIRSNIRQYSKQSVRIKIDKRFKKFV